MQNFGIQAVAGCKVNYESCHEYMVLWWLTCLKKKKKMELCALGKNDYSTTLTFSQCNWCNLARKHNMAVWKTHHYST